MKLTLTHKQEKFVLKYLECGNASEAYRSAYDAERMKSTTVNRKAKALLDHGKIRARLDALSEQVTDRVLYDSASYSRPFNTNRGFMSV